jgi:hypothetical protein
MQGMTYLRGVFCSGTSVPFCQSWVDYSVASTVAYVQVFWATMAE